MSNLTHFERLSKNLNFINARAIDVNQQFSELVNYPEVCIEQSFVNYWVSSNTVPLLEEVISCCEKRPLDPLSPPLISYLKKHVREEKGHENWSLSDLSVFGISKEKVLARMPSANVASMIGSQYLWIKHHPIALMGYVACLEVHHPTVDYVENLIKKSGLPAKGFSSLMRHAKVDVHHKQDIIDTINNLPMSENQYRIMEMSAFQTARYAALVMEEVCKAAPQSKLAI